MTYILTAITISVVLYIIIFYMSYITAAIWQIGISHMLIMPILKSSAFILLCYTIIISDIVLLHGELYKLISLKNGSLLLLVATSLIAAKNWKGD